MNRGVSIVFAALLLSGTLYLAAFGLREILLTRVDCTVCRMAFGHFFQPPSYNKPVAVYRVGEKEDQLYLFPHYVGPYHVEAYVTRGGDRELQISMCLGQVDYNPSQNASQGNVVASDFGRGVILGGFYFDVDDVDRKAGIVCSMQVPEGVDGIVVVRRASET